MATIQELRTIISQDYLRDPNNRVFPVGTVDRAINKGIRRLETDLYNGLWVLEVQATITTVPWQAAYNLPYWVVELQSTITAVPRQTGYNLPFWGLEQQATITTVPWQAEYTLPYWWVRMSLVKWDGTELYLTTLEQIQRENDTLTQGSPYSYYLRGWVIGLYSIPDTAKTLYIIYTSKSETVDATTDYVLPEEWIDAVTAFAASRLFHSVGKFDFANEYRMHYEDSVNKIRAMYQYNDENMRFGYQLGRNAGSDKSLSYKD
jgi:hypothetical protein